MKTGLEVLFTPADFVALKDRDLSGTVCVVFDILRATSTMLTALGNGATAIIPVTEIAEALAMRARQPEVLLAGERDGLRIRAAQTGSIDFDLGNSPREFMPERVSGKTIVMTTTNGTRALQACRGARRVFPGSFLNLGALTRRLERERPTNVLLVCSGTGDEAALEDTLAAGALCERLEKLFGGDGVSDSTVMARQLWRTASANWPAALQDARNGRRLLGLPDLREDVSFCAQRDTLDFVAELGHDGRVVGCG